MGKAAQIAQWGLPPEDSEADFQDRDAAHYFSRHKERDWKDVQETDGDGWTRSELLIGQKPKVI